ncbi:Tannase/feruloyl esterase [Microdochium trichocladiopsis]|uniref:Carboxylic ester hydrolase n=1 Tax=Microdochium trichocladiopsis TaxID=1682393 RepID=A0A9P9BS18_9PEZI|nr:Tannase/feruloyl esterase [Microdochium trichocladiopsis]KAH7033536.1 Tannase/feruloyl esterase [Microdochium trichocladiopsis]
MLSKNVGLVGFTLARVSLAAPQATKCASLSLDGTPPGTSLINITSTERYHVTVENTLFNSTGTVSDISFCDVQLYLTHGDAGDEVRIAVWLPLEGWNGRFMGTGGGGFNAGLFDPALADGIQGGFAAAATDAGVGLANDPGPWADSKQLVTNFVHLSVHEMTIVGKALTAKFYDQKPAYSYWHGCSQGGRQGYVEAVQYPNDYDGISAHAPAINWDRLMPGFLWPYLKNLETPLPACKFIAMTAASISACDLLDGGADGLIGHPPDCKFDAQTLVGTEVQDCVSDKRITKEEAKAWNSILLGPQTPDGKRFWYGMEPGTDLSFVVPAPFQPAESWLQDFIMDDPEFNSSSLTYKTYLSAFATSVAKFGKTWGSTDADLSPFQRRGGKLLTFHGWADQSIPAKSTIEYWERVRQAFRPGGTSVPPGGSNVDDFYRLFMAPGVGHCANFGYGPGPLYLVDALVQWVEHGKAPETLFAAGFGQTRNLCLHPRKSKYKGRGKVEDASSWTCV